MAALITCFVYGAAIVSAEWVARQAGIKKPSLFVLSAMVAAALLKRVT